MSQGITPPITFARVAPGVYRSGFPTLRNLQCLKQLGLKTMIKLDVKDSYADDMLDWIAETGIEVVKCEVAANKEPFIIADAEEICKALRVLLDPARHPVLIHSLVGQARCIELFDVSMIELPAVRKDQRPADEGAVPMAPQEVG